MQPLGSLHLLASENDVPALTFLLDNGADIDQQGTRKAALPCIGQLTEDQCR